MNSIIKTTLAIAVVFAVNIAEANTIRATEMTQSNWSDLQSGKAANMTIEFRERDELPVSFIAEGDLFTTTSSVTNYIIIKRNFWVKASSNSLTMSLDGVTFKPIEQLMTGSFSAGAGQNPNDGTANSIQLLFKAFLR